MQESNWDYISPYILGRKLIKDWPEFKQYYLSLTEYWVSMNSFLWHIVDNEDVPKEVKEKIISWRKRSERYSERANSLEFLDETYPELRDLTWFLTLEELEKVVLGKASDKELNGFNKRKSGCFLFNGNIYPIDELEQKLKEHNLELEDTTDKGDNNVKGTPSYKGKLKGVARVVLSHEDAKKVEQGEVLVAPMTSPDYVSAIKRCSAIVTDEGGALCHASIISRELKIPCIVGTKIATKLFNTGDLIEVDANRGIVKKLRTNKQ